MFNSLRIGPRLAAAFGLVLALVTFMAAIAIWKMQQINNDTEYFAINLMPSYQVQHNITIELSKIRRLEFRHILSHSDSAKDELEASIVESRKKLHELLEEYAKNLVSDDKDKNGLSAVRSALEHYYETWNSVRPLSRQTTTQPEALAKVGNEIVGESMKAYNVAQAAIDEWWAYNAKLGEEHTASARDTYNDARLTIFILLAISMLLGSGSAFAITRSVTRPIDKAVSAAQAVANGDLSQRIKVEGKDETADLLRALDTMTDSLSRIVGQVCNTSDSIATGSAQIATGNADLSQRTEEQASNLQQTSASMMEIRSTVQRNAETAAQATQLATSTSQAAQQGGEVMQQVISTMQDIAASSKKITDIITVIDGIAFQTNILALNAAVEAARAGEQGRGFAVVAGEVRTLAQRSAEAAKEIKSLISASVERVENGSRLVEDAGSSIDGIVSHVRKVSDFINEIGSTASEQTTSISQVTDAVGQLDQVTQQNAALVEESAAAAESLRHQATILIDLVSKFRLAATGNIQANTHRPPATVKPTTVMAAKSAPHKPANTAKPAPAHKAPFIAKAPTPALESTANRTGVTASDSDWDTF